MRSIYQTLALAAVLSLVLSACKTAGTAGSPPVTALPIPPQTIAQQINAHWPVIVAGVDVALIADNANPIITAAVIQQEGVIGPQLAACAAGTDPNCTAQVQSSISTFLSGLKLGPKGTLEIQALQTLLASLVPAQPAVRLQAGL